MHQVCHLGQNFEIRELNLDLEGPISTGYFNKYCIFINARLKLNLSIKTHVINVFYICRRESLNLVKSSTPPPHSIFLSLVLLVAFLFPSSTKRDSFSDLVDPGLRGLVVGFPVDNEPSYLFRKGFQDLSSERKTKVLGHFREWLATLVPMNRHEVSDRQVQQLKPTPIKSSSPKIKESRSFKTEPLVFSSMPQKADVFEVTVTDLVSFKGVIG